MFANNSYAKVWEKKENRIRISISRKKKDSEDFTETFSGWVACYSKAAEKLADIEAGARVQLLNVGVENSYNKETKETRYYFKCFDLELAK